MVHQLTGFVLISAPLGFGCPSNPDLSSECWKVSREKPVRGGGIAEPGRKVPKWSPALGGLVCCSPVLRWRCWGGSHSWGPASACVSISCLWTFRSLNSQESHFHWNWAWNVVCGALVPSVGGFLALGSAVALARQSPRVLLLLSVFHSVPSTVSSLSLIIFATHFCMCCCSSPTIYDSWQDNV